MILLNTRDETRTRKAARPGDFESPASTDSATRAEIGIYTLPTAGTSRYSNPGGRLGAPWRRRLGPR